MSYSSLLARCSPNEWVTGFFSHPLWGPHWLCGYCEYVFQLTRSTVSPATKCHSAGGRCPSGGRVSTEKHLEFERRPRNSYFIDLPSYLKFILSSSSLGSHDKCHQLAVTLAKQKEGVGVLGGWGQFAAASAYSQREPAVQFSGNL